MLEDLIDRELSTVWEAQATVEVAGDSGIPSDTTEPVAIHERGAELYVTTVDDQYLASIVQPVGTDRATADVVTDGITIADKQQLAGWINNVCGAYHSGESMIKAFAIVPHDGTIESIAADPLEDTLGEAAPSFADVFAVYVNQLPRTVDFDDIKESRTNIINLVYGNIEDPPEVMTELATQAEAAGSATVEVFTVTGMDISLTTPADMSQ